MKSFLLFLLLSLNYFCFSQMDEIRGHVKSIYEKVIFLERTEIKTEEFTDEEGNLIRRTYLPPDDSEYSSYGEFFHNPDGILTQFPKTWYFTQYSSYKNVKRIYSKTGKKIQEKWFEYDNHEIENTEYKYDENDSLVLKIVDEDPRQLTRYHYDKLGVISIVFVNNFQNEIRHDSITFTYNENHKVIRKDFFKNNFYNFSEFFKYDRNQNLIENSEYQPNSFIDLKDIKNEEDLFKTEGKKYIWKEFFYDEKNKKIQCNTYRNENGVSKINNKIFYNYDDVNHITLERTENYIDNNNIRVKYFTYKYSLLFNEVYISGEGKYKFQINKYYYYDKNNFIVKSDITDRKESFIVEFKYKFDKKGNWIKQTKLINGVPKFTLERKIEYYD